MIIALIIVGILQQCSTDRLIQELEVEQNQTSLGIKIRFNKNCYISGTFYFLSFAWIYRVVTVRVGLVLFVDI